MVLYGQTKSEAKEVTLLKMTKEEAIANVLKKYNKPKHVKTVGKLNAAYACGCDHGNAGGGN